MLDYSTSETPSGYVCTCCGLTGYKLWRQTNTYANLVDLRCQKCAVMDQIKNESLEDYIEEWGHSDQIGNLCPAVPVPENTSYWGYSSVPLAGCFWWMRLGGTAKLQSSDEKQERYDYILDSLRDYITYRNHTDLRHIFTDEYRDLVISEYNRIKSTHIG